MPAAVIENPILNGPFAEPTRHFRTDDDNNITSEILIGRRPSSYLVPIAAPRKQSRQTTIDSVIPEEKKAEAVFVNQIRAVVKQWRDLGWSKDISPITRQLLEHWTNAERSRRLFFCQVEAVETIIYITEAAEARKHGHLEIEARLREAAAQAETPLHRIACKMATGAGKTAVMAMLIAWQTLNKRRNPRDNRFSDAFLVVSPGITIRDRLRVLLPSDPGNYYAALDIVPPEYRSELGSARITITNFHAFKARQKIDAASLSKKIAGIDSVESPAEVVLRVCKDLGKHREIFVINDEAHHCYRERPTATKEKFTTEERQEAKERAAEARLWLTGLEAVHAKIGVKAVYDLSATPFYLKGSGYPEGTLFPWVVSDFGLIDAIESGVVKIPRVPVEDSAMVGEYPKYRNLWPHVREALKNVRRRAEESTSPPLLPAALEGALQSLYEHYKHTFDAWDADEEGRANGRMPPVFIVVCNNVNVSKAVFDYVAGFATAAAHPDGSPVVAPGKLALFSNADGQRWHARPNAILVDSAQLETGEGMSPEFKKLSAHLIDEFHAQYRHRFPGRSAEKLGDEDLMREVLNTVGKRGTLGEGIRCVVSVSMLTEGWDANTVTHILGVRAFGTQLLCEQVLGRGLRRASYALNADGRFDAEYADIFGVPFRGIPTAGMVETRNPATPRIGTQVVAVPERLIARPWLEIRFPRVVGYRFDAPAEQLRATFDAAHRVRLTSEEIPTMTRNAGVIGEQAVLLLNEHKAIRPQTVAYKLATYLQQNHFRDKPWLFPQLLRIVREWFGDPAGHSPYVDYGDDTFPGLLLFAEKSADAAGKIRNAIVLASGGPDRLRAELPDADATGTTVGIAFDTVKDRWTTDPAKCHLNFVPQDSDWETQVCQKLEQMPEVLAYVKNQSLGFRVPYACEGRPGNYYPDLIVKLDDGRGPENPLQLVLEVSGQKKPEKAAKVDTMRTLWVPAVNNLGTFGRWAFLEIDADNRHKTAQEVRKLLPPGSAR